MDLDLINVACNGAGNAPGNDADIEPGNGAGNNAGVAPGNWVFNEADPVKGAGCQVFCAVT